MRTDALARLGVGTLWLAACYQQHGPQVGGESHFMQVCAPDCGNLECIGDVCTRECTEDEDCASLGSAVACIGGDTPTRPRVCGLACQAANECGEILGSGFTCDDGSCRPAEVAVQVAEAPLVLFIVDTSGSMERLARCRCTTAACSECLPDCRKAERNRWAETLEALTGTFDGFGCEAQERTAENGASYDLGYFLPFHRPMWATQRDDGIFDQYTERVRFGMATFDGWDTYVGFPPLIPVADFDTALSRDWEGLWSYGIEKPFRYANTPVTYQMDTGIRGPGASEGALVVAADNESYRAINAEIQADLLAVRPYGGTPIAAALDDIDYYFATDPEIRKVPVHLRNVILVTDGYPDDDYRSYGCDCRQNIDARLSAYCGGPADCTDPMTCPNHPDNMHCPYDTPENIADRLATGGGSEATQVQRLFVVGFAIADTALREKLDDIAVAAGEPGARTATSGAMLRTAIAAILDDILAKP